jgi:hypothetical protein
MKSESWKPPPQDISRQVPDRVFFDSIAQILCGILAALKVSGTSSNIPAEKRYATAELVRRLLALAWRFRRDCLWSAVLGLAMLLLGIIGLKLLGVVIDVIRRALDPSLPAPAYPFGWNPPAGWPALRIVTVLALAIVALALLRAALTYACILPRPWKRSSAPPASPPPVISSRLSRTATRPSWANRAWTCPAASASAWPWRAPCCCSRRF